MTTGGGSDGSPFPVSKVLKDSGGKPAIRKELGIGEYRAHQIDETVFLVAVGGTQLNVEVTLEQSLTGVFPPSFALYFLVPATVLPAQKSFSVLRTFHAAQPVAAVDVYDAEGKHVVQVAPAMIAPMASLGSDHGNP